jgi:hypothetical protein
MAGRQAAARAEAPRVEAETPAPKASIAIAGPGDLAGGLGNPARDLQRELAAAAARGDFNAIGLDGPVAGRWSKRRTLAFVVISCGAFWAAVAFAIARLA